VTLVRVTVSGFSVNGCCLGSLVLAEWEGALVFSVACAALFVLSLYLSGTVRTHRDDPREVRRRMLFVTLATAAMGVVLYLGRRRRDWCCSATELEVIGLRFDRLVPLDDVAKPVLLVVLLFLGPLVQEYRERDAESEYPTTPWYKPTLQRFRNVVFAPLFEEIVFRSFIVAALRLGGQWRYGSTILLSSLLFGLAHTHHAIHHVYVEHVPVKRALLMVGFQFLYTFVFGTFVGYVYIQTNSLVTVFLVHAFCNRMGLPDFAGALEDKLVAAAYVAGLTAFVGLFGTLTAGGSMNILREW
jgi:prenyl protein peptidase